MTAVRVPTAEEEALRDLVRSRGDILKTLTMNKHRLNQFMQRHGRIYAGKSHWTLAHLKWLSAEVFEEVASQKTAENYRRWVDQSQAELERVELLMKGGAVYNEESALEMQTRLHRDRRSFTLSFEPVGGTVEGLSGTVNYSTR